MRTFSEGKEAGTVTRHLHVILTRSRRENHARSYKAGPVGDVRGQASVEHEWKDGRHSRREGGGAWLDAP
jgi:hypothetical protein